MKQGNWQRRHRGHWCGTTDWLRPRRMYVVQREGDDRCHARVSGKGKADRQHIRKRGQLDQQVKRQRYLAPVSIYDEMRP